MRTEPRETTTTMTRPRTAMGGQGTLVINTIPWARIFIDGRNTGLTTPAMNYRVPAGRHRIGLQTNDGRMHTETVNVAAGQTVRIMKRLQ